MAAARSSALTTERNLMRSVVALHCLLLLLERQSKIVRTRHMNLHVTGDVRVGTTGPSIAFAKRWRNVASLGFTAGRSLCVFERQ